MSLNIFALFTLSILLLFGYIVSNFLLKLIVESFKERFEFFDLDVTAYPNIYSAFKVICDLTFICFITWIGFDPAVEFIKLLFPQSSIKSIFQQLTYFIPLSTIPFMIIYLLFLKRK